MTIDYQYRGINLLVSGDIDDLVDELLALRQERETEEYKRDLVMRHNHELLAQVDDLRAKLDDVDNRTTRGV